MLGPVITFYGKSTENSAEFFPIKWISPYKKNRADPATKTLLISQNTQLLRLGFKLHRLPNRASQFTNQHINIHFTTFTQKSNQSQSNLITKINN